MIRHSINHLTGFCLFKYIITFIHILSILIFINRILALILLSFLFNNPLPQQEPVPVAVIHIARRPVKVKVKDPAFIRFHPEVEPAHPPGACPGSSSSMLRLHIPLHPAAPLKIRPGVYLPDNGKPLPFPKEPLRTGRAFCVQGRRIKAHFDGLVDELEHI